ncbi:MAG TPA: SIMPL domain-containing protein [Candidatus Mcinerneyibacterium sp.]|nr:SIMPL domain-containing protein [Candidatus Mcinerneyibacterium sp.]
MKKELKITIIFSIAIVISSIILGIFFYNTRKDYKTIKVVGMAKKNYQADIIKWEFSFFQRVGLGNLKKGYDKIGEMKDVLLNQITNAGIKSSEVTINPINFRNEYSRGGVSGFVLTQSVFIISRKMEKLEDIALNPSILVKKGVFIQNSKLNYFFSKLKKIKQDILSKATINAKERAEKILKTLGSRTGDLKTIRQGVFQITEPFSTEVSGRGMYNTDSKNKEIKITVHAEFEIK